MEDILAELQNMARKRRPHHYQFAHYFLRGMTMAEPQQFEACARAGNVNEFLAYLWSSAWSAFNEESACEFVPPIGLRLDRCGLGDGWCLYLITLPLAQSVGEAHMVGIAIKRDFDSEASQVRYFTLEVGLDRNVLAEWYADATSVSHLNYGDGPPPERTAFTAAIVAALGPNAQPVEGGMTASIDPAQME